MDRIVFLSGESPEAERLVREFQRLFPESSTMPITEAERLGWHLTDKKEETRLAGSARSRLHRRLARLQKHAQMITTALNGQEISPERSDVEETGVTLTTYALDRDNRLRHTWRATFPLTALPIPGGLENDHHYGELRRRLVPGVPFPWRFCEWCRRPFAREQPRQRFHARECQEASRAAAAEKRREYMRDLMAERRKRPQAKAKTRSRTGGR